MSYNMLEIETDIVIVGYGAAGSAAAIAAHDNGAEVIILEKMPSGGGSTFLSNGGIFTPTGKEFADYLEAICFGKTKRDLIDIFVEHAMKLEDYIREIGGTPQRWVSQEIATSFPPLARPSWSEVAGGKSMVRFYVKPDDDSPADSGELSLPERIRAIGRPYGPNLWALLEKNISQRNIDVRLNTKVKKLIQSDAGAVTGVIAESMGKEIIIKTRKGVIMTTGGFGANEEMKNTFLPCPFCYGGLSYAQGDGMAIAQQAGADLWHMLGLVGQLGFQAPGFEAAFQIRAASECFIFTDCDGRRFCNETKEKVHNGWRVVSFFDPERLIYPRIPCHLIFDETMMKKGPVSRDWRPLNDYYWSLDNSAELEKGWIKTGRTIEELAGKISVPPAELENTIRNFNRYCQDGSDAEFNRKTEFMGPLDSPPYYALELRPMLISTQGGLRHDVQSRALDRDGNPIPGLYAAGELSSIFGWLYEAGGGIAESLVFGKLAGLNAARENP